MPPLPPAGAQLPLNDDATRGAHRPAVPTDEPGPPLLFESISEVESALLRTGYIPGPAVPTTVFLADQLGKPILVEGPAGVGKTQLAKACALARGLPLIRLQCYDGLDESRALYEWNYAKQLLQLQAVSRHDSADAADMFDAKYLLPRPLLRAMQQGGRAVLLIDKVDKTNEEFEALLLEVLSDYAVSIPELGTVVADRKPLVFLTSNAQRGLSDALRRRCLFLNIAYPDADSELEIVRSRVPDLPTIQATQLTRIVAVIRTLAVSKLPSVGEIIDWARTLLTLSSASSVVELDERLLSETLGVILKYQEDIELVKAEFGW